MGSSHGAPTAFFQSGKTHGDTVSYRDYDLLGAGAREPDGITAIRVWHDDHIYGIEVFYDGVSAGARKANNTHPAHMSDLVLAPGEHIVKISGRHGDIVDHLEFHTSLGKIHQYGSSKGGNHFEQHGAAGTTLKSLVTGWGGHLHNIGGVWGVPYVPYIPSTVAGKVHGDTIPFNDFTGALAGRHKVRLSELRVLHDGNLVYGIEAIYNADGSVVSGGVHHGPLNPSVVNQAVPLPEGTHIVKVYGKGGDVMDQLSIELNNGLTYIFGGHGGNPWSIDIPAGRYVKAFAGGLGGHVHNL